MTARPSTTARVVSACAFAALVCAGVLAATRLSVVNDITLFVPEGDDRGLAEVTRALATNEAARTRTMLVRGRDWAASAAASRQLAALLRARADVAAVREGPDAGIERAVRELYWPRRGYLVPATASLDDATLGDTARSLRRRLASATGLGASAMAREDPLGLFAGVVDRLAASPDALLDVLDGRFVTRDGSAALLVTTRASPFDGAAQAPLEQAIDRAVGTLSARMPGLRVQHAGAHRIAVSTERSMRADVTRVSVASTIGIVLLFLLVFRSPRTLLLALVPIAAGFAAAVVVAALSWGRVHGVTLAFGASLIGVCVDYPVHLLTHHFLAGHGPPAASMRRVLPGLLLGAATTVAGLAGLAWTSMPGLREIAIFSSVGVAAALGATWALLPPWVSSPARPPPFAARLAGALARAFEGLRRRRAIPIATAVVALGLAVAGVPRLHWNDDPAALSGLDAALVRQDASVRAQVSGMDLGRFVVARGRTEQQALERSSRVQSALERARAAGELRSHYGLVGLVPPVSAQRASLAALRDPALPARVDAAFAREGFRPGAIAPLVVAYASPSRQPLRFEDVARSALGARVRSLRVSLPDGVAVLTLVGGVRDPVALARRVERVEGARLFDRARFVSRALGSWRRHTLELLVAGLLAVLGLVVVRYRRLRPALAAFCPAVLAAAAALGVLGLFGVDANLMALVGLVLVLSLGVDYGVFVVEQRQSAEALPASLLGIVLASVTTVLSFGLLAASSSPALRALGLVVGVGCALGLVLAPVALVLLEPTARAAVRRGDATSRSE